MISLLTYLQSVNDDKIANVVAELEKEVNRVNEKSAKNRELYDAAKQAVAKGLTDDAMTVAELYDKIAADLPEGFTKSKLQYGLLNYWTDIVKVVRAPGFPVLYKAV